MCTAVGVECVINVERLTSANFQTHNVVVVVVVTALSTLCIAVFFPAAAAAKLALPARFPCLREFLRARVCMCVCVCVRARGVSTEGRCREARTSV